MNFFLMVFRTSVIATAGSFNLLSNKFDVYEAGKTFPKAITRAQQGIQTSGSMNTRSAEVKFSCFHISANLPVTLPAPPIKA